MNSEEQQLVNIIFEKIQEIAEKSIGGGFIYRGESQRYEKYPQVFGVNVQKKSGQRTSILKIFKSKCGKRLKIIPTKKSNLRF